MFVILYNIEALSFLFRAAADTFHGTRYFKTNRHEAGFRGDYLL